MNYMTSQNVEIIDPHNQWVPIKSRHWFIWYFRVGSVPSSPEVTKKFSYQLFASTLLDDKVLTINAPIFANGDFTKAGLIVNDMMESISINAGK
jgi:hypothetical protein